MFEVVIPGLRQGEAYAGRATKKGRLAYIAGVDSNGYPIMKTPTSSAGAKIAHFPLNKLNYQTDCADTALATISLSDRVIYYEGGEYITDDISTTVARALNKTAVNKVFGLAVVADSSGKPAILGMAGSSFISTVIAMTTSLAKVPLPRDYTVGYAVSYTPGTTSVVGWLRYHINPVPSVKTTRTSSAVVMG